MDKHKKNVSWGRTAIAAAAILVVIAGCHKVTGGGWIEGVNGGKATFAFEGKCVRVDPFETGEPESFFYRGQLQFNDRLAGVKVHTEMLRVALFGDTSESCEESADFFGSFGSLYQATFGGLCYGPNREIGFVSVDVVDEGLRGSFKGDSITISIDGVCTSDGQPYSNSGIIQGGNIVIHAHKDAGSSAKQKG